MSNKEKIFHAIIDLIILTIFIICGYYVVDIYFHETKYYFSFNTILTITAVIGVVILGMREGDRDDDGNN